MSQKYAFSIEKWYLLSLLVSNKPLKCFKAKQIAGGVEKTFFHHGVILNVSADVFLKLWTTNVHVYQSGPLVRLNLRNIPRCLVSWLLWKFQLEARNPMFFTSHIGLFYVCSLGRSCKIYHSESIEQLQCSHSSYLE